MEEMPGQNNEQMVGEGDAPSEVNNEIVTESAAPMGESIVSGAEEIVSEEKKEEEKIVSADEKIVTGDEKKKGRKGGAIFGVILALLLTAGGVAFGIYGMMQGTQKDGEISDLKVQVANKDSIIQTLETEKAKVPEEKESEKPAEEAVTRKNPILYVEAPEVRQFRFESPKWYAEGSSGYYVELGVNNGKIRMCNLYSFKNKTDNYISRDGIRECDGIEGISGKIYKVAFAGRRGQAEHEDDVVAFVLEDGTIEYIRAFNVAKEIFNNNKAKIEGKLKINGFVTDVVTVDYGAEDAAGWGKVTLFELADGSYIEYDPSMLN